MGVVQQMLDLIDRNRDRALNGGINCIPSPFKNFRRDFPGIEQGKYYLVSGATKAGKSQIATYLFLYAPILYAYSNPGKLRLKIFYFPLEEAPVKITLRFTAYLLYTIYNVRVSPMYLLSIQEGEIIDEKIRELIHNTEIQDILKFYEEHVYFMDDRNPTGVWKTVKRYADEAGITHKKTIIIENKETGIKQEKQAFDYYEPKDPDEYVIVILDHAGKVEQERGLSKKETIDKLSEYFMILRDRYKYTPVLLQQQNSDTVSLDAVKQKRISPTYNGLMDTKNPGQDCSIMLGITNPKFFKLPDYLEYNIVKLGQYYRALEVVLNREGESNNVLSLYFDGATNVFVPLPKSNDTESLEEFYRLVRKNESPPLELTNPK